MWMYAGIRRAGDGYGVCENGSMHRTAPAEPGRAKNAGNARKQPRQRAGRFIIRLCRARCNTGRDQPANVGTAERTAKKNSGDRGSAKETVGTGIGDHRELGDAGAAWTAGSKNRTLTPKRCYFFRREKKMKQWIKAAGIRAIKTIAQTAVAMIGTSVVISEVDWIMVVSASVLSGVLSLLTSVAGLPELKSE